MRLIRSLLLNGNHVILIHALNFTYRFLQMETRKATKIVRFGERFRTYRDLIKSDIPTSKPQTWSKSQLFPVALTGNFKEKDNIQYAEVSYNGFSESWNQYRPVSEIVDLCRFYDLLSPRQLL